MSEIEQYIISGLNAIEGMKLALKNHEIIPLGINPRIDMIEQLLKTMQTLLMEAQHGENK